MDELLTERVLRAAELVPAGRVASYGDLASIVGIGPRFVGRVMATWGSSVAWWRITSSSGDLPPHLLPEATRHWRDEGIETKANGRGCRITAHRADLVALEAAWQQSVDDLTD